MSYFGFSSIETLFVFQLYICEDSIGIQNLLSFIFGKEPQRISKACICGPKHFILYL